MAITAVVNHTYGSDTAIACKVGEFITWSTKGTTSTAVGNAWRHLDYEAVVSGGVPASHSFGDPRIKPDVMWGPMFRFFFITAGVWTVTLTITEPGEGGDVEVIVYTVTVTEPANTRYCDSEAAGGGDGTLATPWNDLPTAWAWLKANADSVVICSGEFTLSAKLDDIASTTGFRRMTGYGNGTGEGGRVTINCGSNSFVSGSPNGTPVLDLWMDGFDVHITGSNDICGLWGRGGFTRCVAETELGGGFSQSNNTNSALRWGDSGGYDCKIGSYEYCYFSYANVGTVPADHPRRGMVACTLYPYRDVVPIEHCTRLGHMESMLVGCDMKWNRADLRNVNRWESTDTDDQCGYYYHGYNTVRMEGLVYAAVEIMDGALGRHDTVLIDAPLIYANGYNDGIVNLKRVIHNGITIRNMKVINLNAAAAGAGTAVSGANQAHEEVEIINATMIDLNDRGTNYGTRLWLSGSAAPTVEKMINCVAISATRRTSDNAIIQTANASTGSIVNRCWLNGGLTDTTILGRFNSTNRTFAQYESDNSDAYENYNGYGVDAMLDANFEPLPGSPLLAVGVGPGPGCFRARDFYGRKLTPGQAVALGAVEPQEAPSGGGLGGKRYAARIAVGIEL